MNAVCEARGADLPTLVFQHPQSRSLRMQDVRPIFCFETPMIKPGGGLWTSPVTAWENDRPVASAWTDFASDEDWFNPSFSLTVVQPNPGARVALIDGVDDLRRLVEAFPARVPAGRLGVEPARPDWLALLGGGFDAVYLTAAGEAATRLSTPLNLYGWDCATVLWLRPTYQVGATFPVAVAVGS